MVYGLRGWYWKMSNGRLGVVYVKTLRGHDHVEHKVFIESEHEAELARFLQVDLGLQEELAAYHDSKWSDFPKTPPISPRKYRGNMSEILSYEPPVSPKNLNLVSERNH